MDRVYKSNTSQTPPVAPADTGGFPQEGSPLLGQGATVPGPYWFYTITEELRNAVVALGITPNKDAVNQLATGLTTVVNRIETELENEVGKLAPLAQFTGMLAFFDCEESRLPQGWIVLDGRAISRTTYAGLFALYGTRYGTGNGTTTFNVPNRLGRVAYGANSNIGVNIEPELPNITGQIGGLSYDQRDSKEGMTGPFYWGEVTVNGAGSGTSDRYGYFDASRSSPIYKNGGTVKTSGFNALPCVHV